jgi:adenine deaminase
MRRLLMAPTRTAGRDAVVAERAHAADVAAGRAAASAVLVGGRVIDVLSRRIVRADVALAGPRIALVGDVGHCTGTATQVHDCAGLLIAPGLLDPHFHIGFSQLSVERLTELIVPLGTVALSSCFSESGAIAGRKAVDEQLDRLRGSGLDVLLSPFHLAALNPDLGRFTAADLLELVADERCVELREWNDEAARSLPAPLREAWETAVRRGRVVAGHLEGRTGPALQAAVALGVQNDHEATTAEEALERVRLGVAVQMRQGSGARDLANLLPAVTEHGADPDLFTFCSDEQQLDDLLANGHLDGKIRFAVGAGVDPLEAVRMATLNAARSMGVEREYGSVTPGKLASLVLVEDLGEFRAVRVISRGRPVAADGRYLDPVSTPPYPAEWLDTVHVHRSLRPADFTLPLPDGRHRVRIIGLTPGSLRSAELHDDLDVAAGRTVDGELATIAVVDRHQASGRIGIGLAAGLGVRAGAFAATLNAGAFNLMVVGVDPEAMALAANRAVELRGGIVAARDGQVVAEMALPLFGIVSHEPLAVGVKAARDVADALRSVLGSPVDGLLACAGFACMPGIGDLKITDRGLVRVLSNGDRRAVPLAVTD